MINYCAVKTVKKSLFRGQEQGVFPRLQHHGERIYSKHYQPEY